MMGIPGEGNADVVYMKYMQNNEKMKGVTCQAGRGKATVVWGG